MRDQASGGDCVQAFNDLDISTAGIALVRESRIGKSVEYHGLAIFDRGADRLMQQLGAGRLEQQGFGEGRR